MDCLGVSILISYVLQVRHRIQMVLIYHLSLQTYTNHSLCNWFHYNSWEQFSVVILVNTFGGNTFINLSTSLFDAKLSYPNGNLVLPFISVDILSLNTDVSKTNLI